MVVLVIAVAVVVIVGGESDLASFGVLSSDRSGDDGDAIVVDGWTGRREP